MNTCKCNLLSFFRGFSDSIIQDIIYSYLVLPNRITIPLVGDVELAKLRFPLPKVVSLTYSIMQYSVSVQPSLHLAFMSTTTKP